MFLHYPMQQEMCVRILDEMEWHGVIPDKELLDIVVNVFGSWTFATRKIRRQLYWMPKLKYSNKYLDRRLVENKDLDEIELARIALKMMSRDPGTTFSYAKALPKTENDEEVSEEAQDLKSRWIVSAQSPLQKKLLQDLPLESTLYVDGPKHVWVMHHKILYVMLSTDAMPGVADEFVDRSEVYDFSRAALVLRADEDKEPNVHQQTDMTILAMGVLETNDDNVAAAWVNHLTSKNPRMTDFQVVLRLQEDNFVDRLYRREVKEAKEE